MFTHPTILLDLAHDRQRELVAEADRQRLLSAARSARRAWKASGPWKARTVRGRPAGTLSSCEPSAVVPAR